MATENWGFREHYQKYLAQYITLPLLISWLKPSNITLSATKTPRVADSEPPDVPGADCNHTSSPWVCQTAHIYKLNYLVHL